MSQTFQRTLETLYGLERKKSDLGLDGTRVLLAALGSPHERFRAVHVAGTNGKGSVCASIERVLREAGFRTGLFTSPHLVDYRERIRVDGLWVDADWLEATLDRIQGLPEGKGRTFFEVTTALGFAWFAERQVDWAVVEVGLGGRLDSTNVITPELSVITTIGLDHTEILGDTLEKIAFEKAGILKPGVPVVTGVPRDGAAWRTIAAVAAECHAPIVDSEPDEAIGPRPAGMLLENERVARAALAALAARGVAIPADALRRGIEGVRWLGRFERCPNLPRLWWDGAHNPDGARSLPAESFAGIVVALSRDKDVAGFVRALREKWPDAILVATCSRNERAMAPARIIEVACALGFTATEAPDVPSAVRVALERTGAGKVLLTGSLFAVGEAMESFGGAPGERL